VPNSKKVLNLSFIIRGGGGSLVTFVTKVPFPQNWNFSKKRVGAVLLGGGGSV
jgi:hypothetical protein